MSQGGSFGRLSWRGLEPFGVEVSFDFRQPLTLEEQAHFRDLLFGRRLLVMRGQSLSLEQQQDVAGYIGPVLRGERGMAYVDPNDGILNDAALSFHTDLAFAPEPFTALSLHALDVEADQTSTVFADAAQAFRTLRPELKAQIEGRRAVFVQPFRSDARQIDSAGWHAPWELSREVVLRHPTTGDPVLFVNEQHVDHIEGLGPSESFALISALFEHLYAPANIFEHRWRNGDFLLWDNIALQHGRPSIHGVERRKLQRASVARQSLLEQLPDFFEHRPEMAASAHP